MLGPDLDEFLEDLQSVGEICAHEGINPRLLGEASAAGLSHLLDEFKPGSPRLTFFPPKWRAAILDSSCRTHTAYYTISLVANHTIIVIIIIIVKGRRRRIMLNNFWRKLMP